MVSIWEGTFLLYYWRVLYLEDNGCLPLKENHLKYIFIKKSFKVQNMLSKLCYNFIKFLFQVSILKDPLCNVKYMKWFVKMIISWSLGSSVFLNIYFLVESRDEIIGENLLESALPSGNEKCTAFFPQQGHRYFKHDEKEG